MFNGKLSVVLVALIFPVSALSVAGDVHAETAAGRSEPAALEEVVVTAQKRSESLQDVPFSVSALAEDSLKNLAIVDYQTLSRSMPGLVVQDTGMGSNQFVIRGITSGADGRDSPVKKEAVGVYLDEIPLADSLYTPVVDMFDVNRVEVLRGPQGTLFGAGSLAGTVRIVTNDADTKAFAGSAETYVATTADSSESYGVRAMVNLPISDTAALRLVGGYSDDAGFIDNTARGIDGINDARHTSGRMKFLWRPTDELSLKLNAHYDKREVGGLPQEDLLTYPRNAGAGESYSQWRRADENQADELKALGLEVGYDLGFAQLLFASSYLEGNADRATDESWLAPIFFGLPDTLVISVTDENDYRVAAQELRLVSQPSERLRWVAGLYYSDRHRDIVQSGPAPGFDEALGVPSAAFDAPPDTLFVFNQKLNLKQKAVFAELTFDVTDRLAVTGGLRWYDASEDINEKDVGLFFGGTVTQTGTFSDDGINPRFIVAYHVSDNVLLSAQASKGFRLGGFSYPVNETTCDDNLAALGLESAPKQFDSETLWNYELSAKTSWLDSRLIVNGSIYQINYDNLQQTVHLACAFSINGNAGAARSRGAEIEVAAAVTEALALRATAAYTDAQLTEKGFLPAEPGSPLPFTPKFAGSISAHYERPVAAGWRFVGDVAYQAIGSRRQDLENDLELPAYQVASLRLGVARDRWRAGLYVDNLLDRRVNLLRAIVGNGLGPDGGAVEDRIVRYRPRTIGLDFNIYF